MKICFICAPGGHLIELLSLKEAFDLRINIFMDNVQRKDGIAANGN